jgi:hypothetical protein
MKRTALILHRTRFLALGLALCAHLPTQAHTPDPGALAAPAWPGDGPAMAAATAGTSARTALMAATFAPFKPKVRFYWDDAFFYEESDGFPDRTLMPHLMVGITA